MVIYKDTDCAWDFSHSYTATFGDLIAGFAYTMELAGPSGAHYHLWLPEDVAKDKDKLNAIGEEARRIGDVVSMSWQPITPEVEAWFDADKPPKGYIRPDIKKLVQWHKDGKGYAKVFWRKGEKLMIDSFSLSALVAVYEALGDENKLSFEANFSKSSSVATKLIGFCFRHVK
jgi:hypothetical protein